MLRYNIAQLKASANGRPEGYVKYVLKHGKIDGEFILLPDAIENKLTAKFPPVEFEIAQLQLDADRLPKGFADFIHDRGKVDGRVIKLDLATLDELHEKFPVPTFTTPREPTLAEMTANFTQALADWVKVGFKVVEQRVFEQRHTICKACEHWLPDARLGTGKCRKCGCSIYKLWMATSKCPLAPPKW